MPDDERSELSIDQVTRLLRRHRVAVLLWCGFCMAATLAVTLLRGPTFTSRTSFVPQSRRNSSMAAGFAAQLGLAIPGQDQTQSPNFYADLATSNLVLEAVADSGVTDAARRRIPLASFFDLPDDAPAVTRARIVSALRARVSTNVVPKTKDPLVSASILQRILAELERFNQDARRSQASAERRFTERRFDETRAELNAAEQRQVQFLQRNRDFENSPMLRFEADRLQRDVQLKQQVFQTLSSALEQARIDEVRDTPVLSIIEPPAPPPIRDARRLPLKMLGALAFALFVAGALAVLVALRDDLRRAPPRRVA